MAPFADTSTGGISTSCGSWWTESGRARAGAGEGHRPGSAVVGIARPALDLEPELARDLVGLEEAIAIAVERIQELREPAHLAHAQSAVLVGIDQVEEAMAFGHDGERDHT